MSNLLLPAAIAAPPPKPPEPTPPRSPSGERMLTDDELELQLAAIAPAYERFLADPNVPCHHNGMGFRIHCAVELSETPATPLEAFFWGLESHYVANSGRLRREAWRLPVVSDCRLRLQVVAKVILSDPQRFDMGNWTAEGECGTTHCIAGWAIALAPGATRFYDAFGPELTGLALLGHEAAPHFYDGNEHALAFLRTVEL